MLLKEGNDNLLGGRLAGTRIIIINRCNYDRKFINSTPLTQKAIKISIQTQTYIIYMYTYARTHTQCETQLWDSVV